MEDLEKLNILCVEDDLVVADYISSLLDKKRYRVKKINDGKKALDFLLSSNKHLDIILLDYYLPSLDGIQILQSLKKHKKDYPVIFLTVDETLETAVRAMKEGAIDYLSKSSFLKAELNMKIERAYQFYKERRKQELIEDQLSLLTLAVEQSPNSVLITNKDGNIEYVNSKFSQQTGYCLNEIKGKNPRILKTDSYEPGFFEKLWISISTGHKWKGEFVNKKKNGEIYYEKASITPIRNKTGEIVSYLAINEDITEKKKIEKVLAIKTQEMNRFFTVVVDMLSIIDIDTGKFIHLNRAWEDILGHSLDELLNRPYIDFVHPDDIESTLQALHVLLTTGRVLNFVNRYQCKNGGYKFMEWSVIKNEDGTCYGSARDITDRKRNEIILKESVARFQSIFEVSSSGTFFLDKNGQIILANNTLQGMLEYSLHELCLMDFSYFTHLDDLSAENKLLKKLITGTLDQYRIEKRYLCKSGKIIWVDLAMAVIRDDSGEPLNYVGVVNDVTERKQYEEQLKKVNITKDKFFSIISHDLRNQFSGIYGLAEILIIKKDTLSDEKRDRYISLLHQGGKSTLGLLEDLLEWSRLQLNRMEHKPKHLNLFEIVEEVYFMVENQSALKQIEVVNYVDKQQQVYADKNMISTAIRNLLNNAIKFTPIYGKVILTSWSKDNNEFLSIQDSGIGMSPKMMEDLFKIESAHSTIGTEKERGSGLGLILCREFINKHGGEISVKSEVGNGSEFIISLPSFR